MVKRSEMNYALRVSKNNRFLGYIKSINYDLLEQREWLSLSRFRKRALSFDTKDDAIAFIKGSPDLYGNRGYSFQAIGRRKKRK